MCCWSLSRHGSCPVIHTGTESQHCSQVAAKLQETERALREQEVVLKAVTLERDQAVQALRMHGLPGPGAQVRVPSLLFETLLNSSSGKIGPDPQILPRLELSLSVVFFLNDLLHKQG